MIKLQKLWLYVICIVLFSHSVVFTKTIYFFPGSFNKKTFFSKFMANVQALLKDKGYKVTLAIEPTKIKKKDIVICFDIPTSHERTYIKDLAKEQVILFLWEPPVVKPQNFDTKNYDIFGKIYTWYDSLIDNITFFKFHYPVLKNCKDFNAAPFNSKKLCTLIAANKNPNPSANKSISLYEERKRLLNFFEEKMYDFDFYGRGWPTSMKNYKGPVENKFLTLANYKFCFCFENCKLEGYITEKIFDCLAARCVPIYLGAPNIDKYIPHNCFIDLSSFESYEQALQYITTMNEATYSNYIRNIENYLDGPSAHLYSEEHFVKIFDELFPS